MLKEKRISIILEEVRQKGAVSLDEVSTLTNTSRSTIRRDIEELEAQNVLKRVRGGAVAESGTSSTEPSFSTRQVMYAEEKRRIAKAARSLVKPHETLFLGGGTTIHEFSKTLGDVSPLYVATNDLVSATELSQRTNVDLMVLGGSLRKSHYSMHGYFTENIIGQIHADKAFIGIDAVDFSLGYMNFSTEEIQTNKLMIQNSQEAIILCDHSKFQKIAFVNICHFEDIDLLITGKEIREEDLEKLHSLGVKVMVV